MAVPFQVPAVTVPRPVIPVYEPVRRPVGTVSAPPTTLRPVPVKSVIASAPRVRRVTVVEDMVVEARVVLPETVTLPEKVAAAPAKVPETVGEEMVGVVIVGEPLKTTVLVPVSFESDESSCAEVIEEAAVP